MAPVGHEMQADALMLGLYVLAGQSCGKAGQQGKTHESRRVLRGGRAAGEEEALMGPGTFAGCRMHHT